MKNAVHGAQFGIGSGWSDAHAVDGLAIESVCAIESPTRVILYLHGGAFVMGSPASYRIRAMRLSYRCQAEVFVPDYRLAPEHPYPAAFDDVLVAWRFVKALRPSVPMSRATRREEA